MAAAARRRSRTTRRASSRDVVAAPRRRAARDRRRCARLANPDARADIEELRAFGGDRGLQAFAAVDRALAALDRNASSKIVADWLVLQL